MQQIEVLDRDDEGVDDGVGAQADRDGPEVDDAAEGGGEGEGDEDVGSGGYSFRPASPPTPTSTSIGSALPPPPVQEKKPPLPHLPANPNHE